MKPAAFAVLTSLALLSSGTPRTVAQGRASVQAPVFEVDPFWPQAAAESLGDRLDDRRVGRCAGQRLDDPPARTRSKTTSRRPTSWSATPAGETTRRSRGAGRAAGRRADADRQVLQGGAAGARLRPGGQPGEVVGRARAGLRLAGQQSRHHRRSQGQRLAGRQRRQGHADPEVRRRRQVPASDRQARRAQRQQRHRELLAADEDLGGRRGRTRCTSATATATAA